MNESEIRRSGKELPESKTPRQRALKFGGGALRVWLLPGAILYGGGVGGNLIDDTPEPYTPASAIERYHQTLRTIFNPDTCPPTEADVETDDRPHYELTSTLPEYADSLGLTIIDSERYYQVAAEIESAATPEEAIGAVNDFTTEEYGIETTLSGFDKYPLGLSQDDMYIKNRRLVDNLSNIPKELIHEIGVSKIEIRPLAAATANDVAQSAGSFQHHPSGSTIQLDINHFDDLGVLTHELIGHGVHAVSCDGLLRADGFKDEAITQYNPDDTDYIGQDEYYKRLAANEPTPYDSEVYVSAYGEVNALEDVATIAEDALTGKLDLPPEGADTTPLEKKLGVTINRIEELAPNAGFYLTETAHVRSPSFEVGYEDYEEYLATDS